MKHGLAIAWLLFLASIPLWLDNLYVLHVLIMTGIFIIAAMSLNLLLGYTGQLSLGHVAFFGIGAYTSSLATLGFDQSIGNALPLQQPKAPARSARPKRETRRGERRSRGSAAKPRRR